jgi:hypothetical protein
LNQLKLVFTWKYSSSAFRRYVMRTYTAARMATTKVRIPATEAVIERGESVG